MDLTKTAIITGAATGIGRASAMRLAREGYRILVSYRTKKKEAFSLLSALSGTGHVSFEGDISNPDIAQKLVEFADSQFHRVDVLVNAAGMFEEHDVTTVNYERWQEAWNFNLRVNLIAPMNVAFCVAKIMVMQHRGKIINITSRGAFRGEPDAPAYGASKAGLNSASQSMAKALGPHGISVFAIAPGWVRTPLASPYLEGPGGDSIRAQSPLDRVAEPEEIANIVSFLAADGSEWLTGSIIDANGASYLRN